MLKLQAVSVNAMHIAENITFIITNFSIMGLNNTLNIISNTHIKKYLKIQILYKLR